MAKQPKTPETIPEEPTDIQLVVSANTLTITSNFLELKTAIALKLEEYRIEVTEDNLAQAKKDATDLGKAATQLNKLKTEKAKEFSAPVDAFKDQVMELVKMIQDGQEHIKAQVKVFEDKTRILCKQLMTDLIHDQYNSLSVRAEYQKSWASIDSIVGISLVSKGNSLTKAGKERIEQLAANDKAQQDRADLRIAQLENVCMKAGLTSPLTIEHIRPWLADTDESYQGQVNRLVAIELQRQQATQAAAVKVEQDRVKAEQDRARAIEEQARLRAEAEKQAAAEVERKAEEQIKSAEAERQAQEAQALARVEGQRQEQPKPNPALTPWPMPHSTQPAPSIFPAPPKVEEVSVFVRFTIKTAKHDPENLAKISAWFTTEISKIAGCPPFEIQVQKN